MELRHIDIAHLGVSSANMRGKGKADLANILPPVRARGVLVPVSSISRAHCRDPLDVLRLLPANAGKLFPNLSPREAADRARLRDDIKIFGAANAKSLISNKADVKAEPQKRAQLQSSPCSIDEPETHRSFVFYRAIHEGIL